MSPRGFGGDGDDGIVDPCVWRSGRGRRVVQQGGCFGFFWFLVSGCIWGASLGL